jgi:lambda repressor-like predicted transcriptional regulator
MSKKATAEKPLGWDFIKIKGELERNGSSLSQIANDSGRSRSFLSAMIRRDKKSAPVERLIADVCGEDVRTIFPDYNPR